MSKELAKEVEADENTEEVKEEAEAKDQKAEDAQEAPKTEEEKTAEEEKPEPTAEEEEQKAEDEDEEEDDFSEDLTEEEFTEKAKEKGIAKLRKEHQKLRREKAADAAEIESLKNELNSVKTSWEREKNTAAIVAEFGLTDLQLEFVSGSTFEEMKASAQKYMNSLPSGSSKTVKLINGSGTAPKTVKNMTKAEIQATLTKRRK